MNQQYIRFRNFLLRNRWFFLGFLVTLFLWSILLALTETGDSIFFFSDNRSRWTDLFFVYATKIGEAGTFGLALVVLLFVRYRYALAIPLLGFSVSMVSYFSKQFFGHDRPSLYFRKLDQLADLNLIEGVRLNGGTNSFPSGHTMAGFALFAFLAFCTRRKRSAGLFFLALAILVGVSRIYLVQHFLKDVYLGAIMGVLLAMIWYYIARWPRQGWWDGRVRWPGRGA